MFNAIIISNESLTRIGISYSIFWEKFGYTISGSTGSLMDGLTLIEMASISLVFLELPLKHQNSMEAINIIREHKAQVVIIGNNASTSTENTLEYDKLLDQDIILDYIHHKDFGPNMLIKRLDYYSNKLYKINPDFNPKKGSVDQAIIASARQQLLKELLYGWKKYEDISPELLSKYELFFPHKNIVLFMVKLLSVQDNPPNLDYGVDHLMEYLNHKFINEILYFCKNDRDELIIIYNFNITFFNRTKDAISPQIPTMQDKIFKLIDQNFDYEIRIFKSKAYESMDKLSFAYLECSQAYNPIEKGIIDIQNSEPIFTKTIKQYLNKHYQEDISINDLANEVGFNPSYLSTYFKNTFGNTYKNYLIQLRLDQACRLLETTTLQISEIASNVGYPNENYFSKLFKKRLGVSPTKYRKEPNL